MEKIVSSQNACFKLNGYFRPARTRRFIFAEGKVPRPSARHKAGNGAPFALSARLGLGHLCKNKLPSPARLKEQNLQPFPALWKFLKI